jgi:hypothetical protein
VVLYGIQSTHGKFLAWLKTCNWLQRVCTRLFLLPPDNREEHVEDVKSVVERIISRGKVKYALRLQVCPRKSEMAVAVRSKCHCGRSRAGKWFGHWSLHVVHVVLNEEHAPISE